MNAPLAQTNKRLGMPVRFSESVERPEPDEAKTIQGLIAAMRNTNEKTLADGGVYEAAKKFRAEKNNRPIQEPRERVLFED
jgi:hypothetical protein